MSAASRPAVAAICAAALSVATVGHAAAWPTVEVPAGAHMENVASDMILNGKPCRVMRFEVNGTEQDLLSFYRAQFGPTRVVENRVDDSRVIATRQGDYFHTVQLRAGEAHSVQATVITTLLHVQASRSAVAIETARLMPADTAVVSTVQSTDAGKRSVMVVGINRNSTGANRDHLVSALRERGFRIVQPGGMEDRGGAAVLLVFASLSEEAAVTISDAGPYRAVVINRTPLEPK
jgi:hypothetical protein